MMKFVFVTVFALVVAVSARSVDTDDQKLTVHSYGSCDADTYYARTGSKCICDHQGHQVCETFEEKVKRIGCPPGGSLDDGCNTCRCGENGEVTICTIKACFTEPRYCKRGTTYKIGAKACNCNDQGELHCL